MLKTNFGGGRFQKRILCHLAVFLGTGDAGTDALGWWSQKRDIAKWEEL